MNWTVQLPILLTASRLSFESKTPCCFYAVLWYASEDGKRHYMEVMDEPRVISSDMTDKSKMGHLFMEKNPFTKLLEGGSLGFHDRRATGFYGTVAEATRSLGMPEMEWLALSRPGDRDSVVHLTNLLCRWMFANPAYVNEESMMAVCCKPVALASKNKINIDFLKVSMMIQAWNILQFSGSTVTNKWFLEVMNQYYDQEEVPEDEARQDTRLVRITPKLKKSLPGPVRFGSFVDLHISFTIRLEKVKQETI